MTSYTTTGGGGGGVNELFEFDFENHPQLLQIVTVKTQTNKQEFHGLTITQHVHTKTGQTQDITAVKTCSYPC